jgi:hypothetical protein
VTVTDPVTPRAPPSRRLLVLACSARKRADPGLLPAVDRYDGPGFRVLRKYLADAADPPDVLILSARYGLIPADREIPDDDQKLTPDDADALRPDVLRALGHALADGAFAEVALCLGRDYRRAVAGHAEVVPAGVAVLQITGGQGTRLRKLRAWLRGGDTAG